MILSGDKNLRRKNKIIEEKKWMLILGLHQDKIEINKSSMLIALLLLANLSWNILVLVE